MSFHDIKTNRQNNEPLKRSELLAGHGVGALKLTTWGVVMTRNIERWPLLHTVRTCLENRHETDLLERRQLLAVALETYRIKLVEDPRFVRFLQESRGYEALEYLVGIPQIELSGFNTIKPNAAREQLPPSAEYFPKYFFDPAHVAKDRHLRTYADALLAFQRQQSFSGGVAANLTQFRFVPPRSARPYQTPPEPFNEQTAAARPLLEPVPLVLICPHGHLADIPWAKFLGAHTRHKGLRGAVPGRPGLFHQLFDDEPCCNSPQLLWQGGGLSSDSYAGVVLRCSNCQSSTNLAQVGRMRPTCNGGRPWAGSDKSQICTQTMQRALTTGNNLYYPMAYTGLYVPENLILEAPAPAVKLMKLKEAFKGIQLAIPDLAREQFWTLYSQNVPVVPQASKVEAYQLRRDFLKERPTPPPAGELPSQRLKRQEYEVFTQHEQITDEVDFAFRDVNLSNIGLADDPSQPDAPQLRGRLALARRVDELRLTRVQLAFTRVQPLDPDALDENNQPTARPQRVHVAEKASVRVLPALMNRGEGIFLALDLTAIARWEKANWQGGAELLNVCEQLRNDPHNPLNAFQRQQADQASPRQLLVHTLAHLLIRELEWKCGYPAASLQERLYVRQSTVVDSPDPGQAALLIYATEGSQGSMGGLTHQARPQFVEQLLREALTRAGDCPADPICWHADAQAGSPLVRAACFACSMTSETSCELQNTLLDRRVLIDPDYGFFSAAFQPE